MQIQADFLSRPVERPRVLETTALGAALLAERALDATRADPASAAPELDRRLEPQLARAARDAARARWRRAVDTVRAFGSPA
jgi:glycerol kinase